MPSPIQRFYERWEGTLQIATLILIPLVVFLYGNGISRSIEQAKTEQDYIRIATGILSQKVEKDQDQSAIRTWAADVLLRYSPSPLTDEQRSKLIEGDARTAPWGYSDYPWYSGNYFEEVPSKSPPNPSDSDNLQPKIKRSKATARKRKIK